MQVIGEAYDSVAELVRETAGPRFAKAFAKHQAERMMVNSMTTMRCLKHVSQVDLAKRMGCAQSKVSKIESSVDADLSFDDIVRYAVSLGYSVNLSLSPHKKRGVDRIRHHLDCMKRELELLVEAAGDDECIGPGVESFAVQTVQRMVEQIDVTLDKLPHRKHQQDNDVSVDVEDECGRRIPTHAPKPKRTRASAGTHIS